MSASAIALVVSRSHKLLCVTNRHYKGFGLPGGKAEDNEGTKETCCRELREETGLVVLPEELRLVHVAPSCTNVERIVYVYHVTHASGHLRAAEDDTVLQWFSFNVLCNASPFAEFYLKAWPDGVDFFVSTDLCVNAGAPA